ncbi:hypothetical protein HHI36_011941 [Cryptolaemus montrouzieri]|uniref:Uncharacterized protein n=1 Tax=Cryptolaemus montrouzieri TaxID=559131 RepID=A0ABD2NDL2_9CUCU
MTIRNRTSLFIFLLLAFITYIHTFDDDKNEQLPYSIDYIQKSAGLFYNSQGMAKFSSDWFTLLSFTNISVHERTLDLLKRMCMKSANICSISSGKNITNPSTAFNCKRSVERLNIRLTQLQEKFESISHLTGHNFDEHHRTKRGLINGVSYAIKWLFGTPDADDAQYYTDAIQTIHDENVNTQKLMKQQIHILSDAISTYNKSCLF